VLKISCAGSGCLGLSPVISAQFTVEMCVAVWNRKKITKNPYFGVKCVQGHQCISVSSAVLVMISSKSVTICTRSHARRVNSGEITISWGTLIWCPRSREISPSSTKFAHRKLETLRRYAIMRKNPESLHHLGMNRYRVVTDGETDRQHYDS